MTKIIKTLAIETSCDDTSVGIVSFDGEVFSVEKIFAYTQIKDHNKYWWVVPEIASRLHSDQIIPVIDAIGLEAIKNVDHISVTTHPWLPWSLLVGESIANMLGSYFNKPVIEVNHVVGHIVSLFLDRKLSEITFPMLVLTVSGGHNDLYLVNKDRFLPSQEWQDNVTQSSSKASPETNKKNASVSSAEQMGSDTFTRWNLSIKKIWTTLDDAAGECFDKVARMIWWPYPWGAWIGQQALKGKENPEFDFNKIWLSHEEFNFSFSGLKGQIHNLLHKWKQKGRTPTEQEKYDIAYAFQENVVEVLSKKLVRAGMELGVSSIAISGGVSANDRWREYVNELTKNEQRLRNNQPKSVDLGHAWKFDVYKPEKKLYSTDNAAMIGVAGILKEKLL